MFKISTACFFIILLFSNLSIAGQSVVFNQKSIISNFIRNLAILKNAYDWALWAYPQSSEEIDLLLPPLLSAGISGTGYSKIFRDKQVDSSEPDNQEDQNSSENDENSTSESSNDNGDDREEEEEDNNFEVPNETDAQKAFKQELDDLAQKAEDQNLIIVFSSDIDGTIFFPPEKKHVDRSYYKSQSSMLDIFKNWLYDGRGKERVLLIYNTARKLEVRNWKRSLEIDHIPEPHFIIHSEGLSIIASYKLPTKIIINISEISRITRELNAKLASRQSEFTDKFKAQSSDSTTETVTAKNIRTRTENNKFQLRLTPTSTIFLPSYKKDIFDSSKRVAVDPSCVEDAAKYFSDHCAFKGARMLSYTYRPDNIKESFTLHMDRTINKGTTLVLLLDQLRDKFTEGSAKLFTAGDDTSDVPALFLDLLSQAYLPDPESTDEACAQKNDTRNTAISTEDLAVFQLTSERYEAVLSLWSAGIVAPLLGNRHNEMRMILDDSKLNKRQKLLIVQELGIRPLINIISTSITDSLLRTAP